jgi:hypothetical protein
LTAGDPDGVGRRVRYLIKGRLPMRLAFAATITRVDPPRELELRAEGELAGTGRWDLQRHGDATSVRYTWDVHTTKPWMNLAAPLARPLFTWNSKAVMLAAGEGLARYLQVPLVDAEFTARPGRPRGRCGGRPWPRWRGCCCGGVGRSDSTAESQPTSPTRAGRGPD